MSGITVKASTSYRGRRGGIRLTLLAWVLCFIPAPTSFGQNVDKAPLPRLVLTADEAKVWSVMRVIASAEFVAIAHHGRSVPLAQLKPLIGCDEEFADGMVVGGYVIKEVSIGGTKKTLEIKAEPLNREEGRYSFNMTEDSLLRYVEGPVAAHGTEGVEFEQVSPASKDGAQLAHAAERAQREFVLDP